MAFFYSNGGGGGGGGGAGIGSLASNFSNSGTVAGGLGGAGGNGAFGTSYTGFTKGNGGGGGGGGDGIATTASGLTITNQAGAYITGGNGGAGGAGSVGAPTQNGQAGAAGAGGAGIAGANLTVVNSGTITGGTSGDGARQADAITFTGGTNNLTITSTSAISGRVLAHSTADKLVLGGDTDATFDLSQLGNIGSAAQYQRFGILDKSGVSTWTLSNAPTSSSPLAYEVDAGTLDLGGTTQTIAGLTLTGGTLSDGEVDTTGTFAVEAGTVSAVLGGSGAVDKTTTGTVTLTGANTYTGGTTIEDGTLAVSGDANLGDASGGLAFTGGTLDMTTGFTTARDVTIAGTGTIEVDSGTGEIDGIISNGAAAGALDKTGAGTLTLGGVNTYSGGTTVEDGTLAVSADENLGDASGGLTLTGSTLDMTTGFTTARDVSIAGTGTVEVESGTGEIDGAISDGATAGALDKTGAGTLTLTGTNTYSGGTAIAAGSLAVSTDANLGDASGGLAFTGGTLDMTTGFTTARDVTIAGTGTVEVDSGTGEIDGVISNGATVGALDKTGTGTLTLTGANTYTGGTTIAAGKLAVSADANLGDASGGLAFTGGTLDMTTGFTTARDVSIAGTGTVEVDSGTGEIDGVISDGATAGALDKTGAGTLTLTGTNTYTDGTTLAGGTLAVSADANLGAASGGLALTGGVLDMTTGFTTARDVTIAGTGTVEVDSGTGEIDGVISDGATTGTLEKTGAGTLTLGGANTYSGGTTIAAGKLAVSADANLGDTSGRITFTGGTLDMTTGFTTGRDVSITGTGTIEVDSGTGEIDGVISDSTPFSALLKTGAGTLTLTGANTYTGGTTIAAGTLAVSNDANLGDASGRITFTGGTLDMTTGFTTGHDVSITGTGTIEVDSGTGEIDGFIFDGANAGVLDKTGAGTLTLTAANIYSGGTTIAEGTLAVSADANLGDASGGLAFTGGTLDMTTGFTTARDVSIAGTGTVEVESGTGEIDGVISDGATAGALDKTGAGTLTLTGTNTYSGGTTIAEGTLAVSTDANLGDASGGLTLTDSTLDMTTGFTTARDVSITGTGTIEVDSGTGEIDGVISDGAKTGALLKTGAGTLTLGGVNTYSGGTNIADGTLAVSADENLGDASGGLTLTGSTLDMTTGFTTARNVTIVGTGTFEVDSGSGEIDGRITQYGNSGLIKTGAGTLTLTGANFYFGGTTIAAGTLAVSETRHLGYAYGSLAFTGGKLDMTTGIVAAGDVTIAGTGTVEVDSGTGEFDGTISDGATTGALLKTGAATLTLKGANTYSGGTTIAAGKLDLESAATVVDGVVTMGAAGTGAIKFSPSSSVAPLAAPTTVLELGKAAQPESGGTFSNTLDDFGDAGEAIDLENYSGAATAVFVPDMLGSTNGTLTVSNGAVTEVFSLTNAKSTQFVARSDNQGGTIVEALCFAAGTRIRVARGNTIVDAAVEDLLVGDLAVTASGALRLIRWLGHRTVAVAGGLPSEQRPVRIRAGAFGPAVPTRDLFLSPGHPVLVGSSPTEVLVPIMCLINGTTIDRVAADSVTWWHVELDAHDILLADNLPAESYLDWGDRAFFTEGADHALANPDFVVPGLAGRCRPVAIDGPVLEAERQRLDMVFALRLSSAAAWPDAYDTAFLV